MPRAYLEKADAHRRMKAELLLNLYGSEPDHGYEQWQRLAADKIEDGVAREAAETYARTFEELYARFAKELFPNIAIGNLSIQDGMRVCAKVKALLPSPSASGETDDDAETHSDLATQQA